MVDGVLLLVDASEGPLPQTRFVLRKALECAAAGDPRGQQGRPAGRAHRRGRRRGLRAVHRPRRAPRTRSSSRSSTRTRRAGWASLEEGVEGTDLKPLMDLLVEHIPAPEYDERPPAAGARHQPRRVARTSAGWRICRVRNGTIRKGEPIAWCRADGTIDQRPRRRALRHRGAGPRRRRRRPGRARSSPSPGMPEVTIGETLADPDDPRPLPVITVDEPSLSVTIGNNTSPLAGQRRRQADLAPDQGAPRRRD